MPPPVSVLYITPSVKPLGARQSLLELIRHLDRTRWHPIVACPSEGGIVPQLRAAGAEVEVLPLRNYRKGKYLLLRPYVKWRLRQIARKWDCRLVHCNEFWPFPYTLSLQRLGLPVLVHLRGPITWRQVEKYHVAKANQLICISRGVAAYLEGTKAPPEIIRILPNGLSLEAFPYGLDGSVFREELKVSLSEVLVALAGRITERKGHHYAVEAVRRLRAEGLMVHLAFLGEAYDHDQEYLATLESQISRCNLESSVHFAGFRSPVAPALAGADILVLPSSAEGFGRVLIEAMALGKPCVAFDSEGVGEVIANGDTGVVVPVGDGEALYQALKRLVEDEGLRIQWGTAGRRRVEAHFTIETHVKRIEEVYREVLEGK